jgi:hypothetical protein
MKMQTYEDIFFRLNNDENEGGYVPEETMFWFATRLRLLRLLLCMYEDEDLLQDIMESIGLSGAYEDSPARYGGHRILYSFPVIISRWKICFKHLLWLQ